MSALLTEGSGGTTNNTKQWQETFGAEQRRKQKEIYTTEFSLCPKSFFLKNPRKFEKMSEENDCFEKMTILQKASSSAICTVKEKCLNFAFPSSFFTT